MTAFAFRCSYSTAQHNTLISRSNGTRTSERRVNFGEWDHIINILLYDYCTYRIRGLFVCVFVSEMIVAAFSTKFRWICNLCTVKFEFEIHFGVSVGKYELKWVHRSTIDSHTHTHNEKYEIKSRPKTNLSSIIHGFFQNKTCEQKNTAEIWAITLLCRCKKMSVVKEKRTEAHCNRWETTTNDVESVGANDELDPNSIDAKKNAHRQKVTTNSNESNNNNMPGRMKKKIRDVMKWNETKRTNLTTLHALINGKRFVSVAQYFSMFQLNNETAFICAAFDEMEML